ncbi:putative diguanylate cyclase YeaP [Marinomonas gallaica]|uniref:diguanylate cyclase n=1 Tax=Marinomonas gallaica TaxID=1806667 RepID=A0A1C3JNU2_9GAMM|nr:diguanylate cyclase [Marinomonas gallaica]SBT16903.1 putative diguanylate cyclase YeaP [Marinomonas gallaica]SBT22146.1 putative diguanylate cyclase YeaP [Marinomonas gallaica]
MPRSFCRYLLTAGLSTGACFVLLSFSSLLWATADSTLQLGDATVKLDDNGLWHPIQLEKGVDLDEDTLSLLHQSTQPSGTIIGQTGRYLTKLSLSAEQAQSRFVVVGANFLDNGVAYWQPEGQQPRKIANFATLSPQRLPDMLHAQAFPLTMSEQSSGVLWIIISAQYYPTPITLTLYNAWDYYQVQGLVGLVTQGSVFVMLTLALLALAIYFRTKLMLTFWFAGYVGLHGIGWAVASGEINSLLPSLGVNLTYAGMHLFPIAIACAAMFTAGLFNTQEYAPRLYRVFRGVAVCGVVMAVIMLWLPFIGVFYLAHILALIWVPLSIFTGITMLTRHDFKAKYYLTGNLLYGSSLVYYTASHALAGSVLPYPELVVLAALALDCFCILLSLSEWLRVKQKELTEILYQAKVDMLTNVGNRFAMNEKLSELNGDYWIVFIDFDGMKTINDSLGHKEGDRFLIEAASLMRDQIAEDDSVFRVGGDEFVWLLEAQDRNMITLKSQLQQLILNIETELKTQWPTSGISYGFSKGNPKKDKKVSLTEADEAMYQHKQSKHAQVPSVHDSLPS